MLAYKQPENLEQFLIETLKQRKVNGNRSIVYTDSELQNIYSLYDLKGSGFISPEVCKEGKCILATFLTGILTTVSALKNLANSEFHYKRAEDIVIKEKVDVFGFIKLCDDCLGIKSA